MSEVRRYKHQWIEHGVDHHGRPIEIDMEADVVDAADHDRVVDEMQERIERLETALKYFKPILEGYLNLNSEVPDGLSPEFYHTLGYASEIEMVETARRHLKALEWE